MNDGRFAVLNAERKKMAASSDPADRARLPEIEREMAELDGALDNTPRSTLRNLTKR